jgi:HK97 family phage major capsid protein
MPYDSIISRTDAQATIPEDVAATIMLGAIGQSAALTAFRHVPMSRAQQRIPVISALPVAYFVNGDTGLKQTTEAAWTNKYLDAEEIAAIVPIPEAVLDDASFDVWGSIKPLLEEAIGRTLDAAVFFGVNKPASWPTDIVTAATSAGNEYFRGTNNAAAGGIAQDISNLFGLVEADGYDVSMALANRAYKGRLRGARDSTGVKLDEVTPTSAYGVDILYPMRGLWPATGDSDAELIVGDASEAILGVRQDITYKVLDQAVIQDQSGAIIYNLAQQDMVALRVVARFAWQVANVINRDQPVEASRYPFGVMRSPNV